GFCDLVGNGTLFLDEIGDLTPLQQKYLLKLIDEKEYRAVGDINKKTFSGTIIMATHKDLEEMVQKGKFREDLYFRVRVFWKQLPSLIELDYDIKSLIEKTLESTAHNYHVSKRLDPELLEQLTH